MSVAARLRRLEERMGAGEPRRIDIFLVGSPHWQAVRDDLDPPVGSVEYGAGGRSIRLWIDGKVHGLAPLDGLSDGQRAVLRPGDFAHAIEYGHGRDFGGWQEDGWADIRATWTARGWADVERYDIHARGWRPVA